MEDSSTTARSIEELEAENAALRARIAELEANHARRDDAEVERALRESYQVLFSTVEQSPAIVFVKGLDRRYLLVNRRAVEAYGRTREEILGSTDSELLPREAALAMQAKDDEALRSGRPIQFEESLTGAGEVRHYLTVKFPIHGLDGGVIGVCGVSRDITEEKRAEMERAALQERVIRTQDEALRERSTPLMPLAEGVIAMPLVGTIDSVRADQIMSTLLDGISRTRAHTAILDITGVGAVDTSVANALLRAAQAARLLGARVVLTGIRPEVAQTLVQLAADLRGIVTLGTLQSGIAYALRRR